MEFNPVSNKKYSITLGEIIDEFGFVVECGPENYRDTLIYSDDLNRCGLQLAGFYDLFDPNRLQLIGNVETSFVAQFSPEKRMKIFDTFFSKGIPATIITRNIEPFPECVAMAKKYGSTILRTTADTASTLAALLSSLKVHLAERVTVHGVLLEVYGEGILLLGDSGIGKSENAIELVKRGHRLIADDAVEVKKVSSKTLVGAATQINQHMIELRGIGVVDAMRLFGMGSVKPTEKIDLIIHLEDWVEGKCYSRLGDEVDYTNFMGINIPSLTIPVKPGRNLAIVIEVAAMNNRNIKFGYNAANELIHRMNVSMGIEG
ncbi:MAG: HPr(Ser) kinase/phosphatase [Ruminococcaceae bacterium]|nr:HPr(Ser) kinase/phosphatase [Oscillospiraceae bacterium]